jgi:Cu/Ag efflux protein CusF
MAGVVANGADSRQRVLASRARRHDAKGTRHDVVGPRPCCVEQREGATMKRLTTLIAAGLLSVAAFAQPVEGEVRKVDKAQAKLTLKHGEIKNLDMPPMTMVYRVRDAKMLDGLSEGAKVRFAAEKIDGQYTITQIKAQ